MEKKKSENAKWSLKKKNMKTMVDEALLSNLMRE
jgi:hypothetical protein